MQAGKYALFTIPYQDHWTVIVNKRWNAWGSFGYEEQQDVGRIDAPVIYKSTARTEKFTIEIDPQAEGQRTTFRMLWEQWAVEVPLEVQPNQLLKGTTQR